MELLPVHYRKGPDGTSSGSLQGGSDKTSSSSLQGGA